MTKNKTAKEIRIRLIVVLILLITLLAAAVSYAWFRNTIEVPGVNLQTGTFQYQFIGYHKNASSSELKVDFAYSTMAGQNESFDPETGTGYYPILQDGTLTAVTDHTNITNDIDTPGEIYYVVRKLDPSVDLDISINLEAQLDRLKDFSGSADSIEAVGGFWYSIVDITGTAESRLLIEQAINDSTVFQVEGIDKQERKEEYFPDIRNEFLTATLDDSNEYWCFRLRYGIKPGADTSAYTGKKIDLAVNLCVAQKGGLEGDDSSIGQHYVRTLQQFKDALLVYKPNDSIIVQEDITYEGDLIFNRPIQLQIVGSELTVKGNLRFNYASEGSFTINTALAGQLSVLQMDDVEAGGNLYFDIPHSTVEIIGQNSADAGNADIYVQNVFSADVNYDQGLLLTRSRISALDDKLKTIYLRNESTIDIFARTTVGTITVHNDGKTSTRAIRVHIVNKGTVEEINLVNMGYVPGAFDNPRIFIDNYGNIERGGVSTPIKLPDWSCKWYDGVTGSRDQNNTRIIRQQGAGFMSVGTTTHQFKSDGSGVESRDDIEYKRKETLINKEPDSTHIVVHYMDNDIFVLRDESGEIISDDTSLENIIEYYLPDGPADEDFKIAALDKILSLKVICYGKYVLTEEDYAFIRTMSALQSIDLKEAVSAEYGAEGRKVPDNAFAGLSSLKFVTLSDMDNALGSNLFVGTNVDEIKLPVDLKHITTESLKGIKYLHVGNKAEIIIDNVSNYTDMYLFCSDENTREKFIVDVETKNGATERYKEKLGSAPNTTELNRISKIFLDAERHGDYFVNLHDNTCYIITYVGDNFDAGREQAGYTVLDYFGNEVYYKFDFVTLRIGNQIYQVAGYDDFAFYGKTLATWVGSELKFSDNLSSIGDAAFYNVSLPKNVDLGGCKTLGHAALAFNKDVRTLRGAYVETLGFWACGDMAAIQLIYLPSSTWNYGAPFGGQSSNYPTRLEIGLLQTAHDAIDKTATGYHKLYATKTQDANTTVFVHNDNMSNDIVALTPFTKKPYRAFAPADCISLLSAAGCTAGSLGNYNSSDVKFMAAHELEFGAYAYLPIEGTSDYELLVYMNKSTVDCDGGDFVVPAYTDANGVVYKTTSIRGSAFYYATFINVDTLTFADSYENIGSSAFTNRLKSYDHLDLNNVKTVGSGAFKSSTAVTIIGNHVTSVGTNAFNGAKNLVTASLKNLGAADSAFNGCSSLRMAAVGPVTGSNIFSGCTSMEILFVNVTGVTKAPGSAYLIGSSSTNAVPFTVVSIGGEFSWESSVNSPYKDGVTDPYKLYVVEEGIENVLFSDWVTKTVTANGRSHSLNFPSFMYVKQADESKLALMLSFEFEFKRAENYVLPDIIYRIDGTENVTTILGNSIPRYTYVDAGDGTTIDTGMHVTRIEANSFKNLLNVTNITFPHSIEYIGESAFEGCIFGDVVLNGNGMLIIGQRAFYDATMESLSLSGTNSIGKEAFASIQGASASSVINAVPVILGDVLTYIGESAFEGAYIASITSTHNATNNIELNIDTKAFRSIIGEASGEVSVNFGGAYVLVGEYAFEGVMLSNVTMPNMRLISGFAFNMATISGKLDLSGSGRGIVPTVMPYAFKGESSSKKMNIGSVILGSDTLLKGDFSIANGAAFGKDGSQVYEGAFTDCLIGTFDFNAAKQPEALAFVRCGFDNIYFGEMEEFSVGVTGAGTINYAEAENQSIDHPYMVTNVNDSNSRRDNTAWTKFIFRDCTAYGNIYFESVTTIGSNAFGRNSRTDIQSVDFENVTTIETTAFRNIDFKKGITLGDNVTLKAQAFSVCTIDGEAYLGDGLTMTSYSFINTTFNGTLSLGSYTSSSSYSNFASTSNYGKTINKVKFRDTCTTIPKSSFSLIVINEIDFNNVKTIGEKAFADSQIGKVLNMKGVTTIGANAFGRYDAAKSYLIPSIGSGFDVSGVISVGNLAFEDNTIGQNVDLSSATNIGTAIFKNATINANVTLGNRKNIPSSMFELAIINGVFDFSKIESIETNAFKGAKLSQDLIFDNSITIAESAFNGATLQDVKFVGSGSIASEAFANTVIGVLNLGALTDIAGAEPTINSDGTLSGDTTGAFHHAEIDEIHIENAADPKPLSFAYAKIGVLDFGNLTQSGVKSGVDENGFKTPFYGVTLIKRIDFGKLQTLGMYYFNNVEILEIGSGKIDETTGIKDNQIKSISYVGAYAFRNCDIYEDVIFASLVELKPNAVSSTDFYKNVKFLGGMNSSSSSESGSLISSSNIKGDMYVEELIGNWYANKQLLNSSKVSGKFTLNKGVFKGSFLNSAFLGDIDISRITGASGSSNGVFINCSFKSRFINANSISVVTFGLFSQSDFEPGTVISLNSATSIGKQSFSATTGLSSVIIPNVTSIGEKAFSSSSALTTVNAPKLLTIGNYAFSSCSSLTTLVMPEVTSIGTKAFESCIALKTASFPKAQTVGFAAFQNSTSLHTVSLPSVTTITGGSSNAYSFVYNCSALEKIILGENFVGWTGGGALISGCSALKQVIIMADPDNITGTNMGLASGAKLLVPNEMKAKYDALLAADGDGKLWGSVSAAQIETVNIILTSGEITYIASIIGNASDKKIEIVDIFDFGSIDLTTMTEFAFPHQIDEYTVVSIGVEAIRALTGVEKVVLPKTLEYINFSGIYAPTSITAYEISDENDIYKTVGGILYSKDGKTLVLCPSGFAGNEGVFTLDENVTVIGENAFAGNTFITKINIDQQIIVADSAFAQCISLAEINFTSEQASIFIGRDIIEGCSESLVIKVPSVSLETYKQFVFYDTNLGNRIVSAS